MFQVKPIFFLIIFSAFFFKGFMILDPDFGWRVKAGKYYFENGIPKTDIFTYTMPNFPWVDHAWGTSLLFYLVNNYLGYATLVLLMLLFVALTILLLSKTIPKSDLEGLLEKDLNLALNFSRFIPGGVFNFNLNKVHPLSFFPLILVISILLPFFGVRAQVISWFMFSVLTCWLSKRSVFKKFRFIMPAFFLLWANFHGSFALGIAVFLFYLFTESLKHKKVLSQNNLIGVLSFFITFLNPYGTGTWREAWSSASDAKLRWSIAEWMPALTMFDLAMVFLICLSIVLIWKYRKKFSGYELAVFLFLFAQAISSKRQLPLWAIFSFPLVTKGLLYFWNDLEKIRGGRLRFIKVYKIAWIISIGIFIFQASFSIKDAFAINIDKFYPVSAVDYLKANETGGEIFSEYGWGGYLIWQLPQKKVFIDGRMPSWRWEPVTTNDLKSAFDTYNEILKGEADYKKVFDKFNVHTVLAHKSYDSESPMFDKIKDFLSVFGWEENDFNLLQALEEEGWEKVYEDEIAVIYQKE